jgi:hypothetical protein
MSTWLVVSVSGASLLLLLLIPLPLNNIPFNQALSSLFETSFEIEQDLAVARHADSF